jgi:exportin-7
VPAKPAQFKLAARHESFIVLACSRGPALEPFVVTSLVQLLCRTTKLCWFDDDAFRNIVDDAKQFLEKVSARPQTWTGGSRCLATHSTPAT